MKQETRNGKHTDALGKQHGWSRYWRYAFVPFGISAFAAYWTNRCDHQCSATNTAPHYHDMPVDVQLRGEADDVHLPLEKHERLYVEPSRDSHTREEFASLPSIWKGGGLMDP